MPGGLLGSASLRWVALVAICAFGCQPAPASDAQRARSFALLSKVDIAGEALDAFLRKRTAVLAQSSGISPP